MSNYLKGLLLGFIAITFLTGCGVSGSLTINNDATATENVKITMTDEEKQMADAMGVDFGGDFVKKGKEWIMDMTETVSLSELDYLKVTDSFVIYDKGTDFETVDIDIKVPWTVSETNGRLVNKNTVNIKDNDWSNPMVYITKDAEVMKNHSIGLIRDNGKIAKDNVILKKRSKAKSKVQCTNYLCEAGDE